MCRWILIGLMVIGYAVAGLTYEDALMCETCHLETAELPLRPDAPALAGCETCHTDVWHEKQTCADDHCSDCHDHGATNRLFVSAEYQSRWITERVDPHANDYMCTACHSDDQGALISSNDERLCGTCHSAEDVNMKAHSSGFTYTPSRQVNIPPAFPLKDRQVVCRTCHEFGCDEKTGHSAVKGPYLRTRPATREQFCVRCHQPEPYQRHNPHIQFNNDGSLKKENCTVCHTRQPDLKADAGNGRYWLKGDINAVCQGCHMLRANHPTGTNHLRPIPLRLRSYVDRKIRDAGVPFPLGEDYEVLCITCHTPHQYELMPEQATEKSRNRTRYLSGYDLCVMCHIK